MDTITVQAYGDIIPLLNTDEVVERIIKGQISVPDTDQSLLNVFPPALIPLWSTGARTVVGLWKHWFSAKRRPTFVEFYGTTVYGTRNIVVERARTCRQLLLDQVSYLICIEEGVSKETVAFAEAIGVTRSEVEDLDRRSIEGISLDDHAEFTGRLPLSYVSGSDQRTHYTGDFPTSAVLDNPATLNHCSVLEVHSGFKDSLPDYSLRNKVMQDTHSPEWFHTTTQNELFNRLLEAGNLEGAWMCLNSPKWELLDARAAIRDLANLAEDHVFTALATVWASLPFPDNEMI